LKVNLFPEEYIASIFRVKEYAQKETSMKADGKQSKVEAICLSETSAGFQWTTKRYIPADGTLHNHHCENLKSYIGKNSLDLKELTSSISPLIFCISCLVACICFAFMLICCSKDTFSSL
jgi:hypothetical protein